MKTAKAGRKQIAKLTKRQLGAQIGQNVLRQISDLANGIRDLLKGKVNDGRTSQPIKLECSVEDIRRSWSTEQHSAIEEFISIWSIDPPREAK